MKKLIKDNRYGKIRFARQVKPIPPSIDLVLDDFSDISFTLNKKRITIDKEKFFKFLNKYRKDDHE